MGFRLRKRDALVVGKLDIHLMWQQAQPRSAASAKYAIEGEATKWAEIQKAKVWFGVAEPSNLNRVRIG